MLNSNYCSGAGAPRGRQMFRIGGLILAAQCLLMMSIPISANADTNGPGRPSTTFPFAANACGPCTDTNTWTLGVGPNIGNGACGRCGNINYQRSTGTCQGTDPGTFNCKQGNCDSHATDRFASTPVGSLGYAGCVAAAIAGGILAELVLLPACAGACTVGAVVTIGASCVACIAAQAGTGTAVACGLAECIENCNFLPNRVFGGPTVQCCN
jgi:hypothetical protein